MCESRNTYKSHFFFFKYQLLEIDNLYEYVCDSHYITYKKREHSVSIFLINATYYLFTSYNTQVTTLKEKCNFLKINVN